MALSLRTSQPETAQRGGCVKVSNAESRPGPPGSPQPHPCGFWAPEDTACPLPTRTCSQEARGSPTGLLTTKDPHGVQRRWGVNLASHPEAERVPKPTGLQPTEHLPRKGLPTPPSTCTGLARSGKIAPAAPGAEGRPGSRASSIACSGSTGPRLTPGPTGSTHHTSPRNCPVSCRPGFVTRREGDALRPTPADTAGQVSQKSKSYTEMGALGAAGWAARWQVRARRGVSTDTESSHGAGRARPRTWQRRQAPQAGQ